MQTKQYKFVLLGDVNSGKTSIARRLCESDEPRQILYVSESSQSINRSYQSESNFDLTKTFSPPIQHHKKVYSSHSIDILDIAGKYEQASIGEVKNQQPDAIIIVVDSTNDDLNTESFQQQLKIAADYSPPNASIYICLSKNDYSDDCLALKAQVTSAFRSSGVLGRKLAITSCSAQENSRITKLFDNLIQQVPSIQPAQKSNAASTEWHNFFFKNYPNWLIGLIVLSLLIEFANLSLQILSFFPEGQFLALGLTFDYAAPTMHGVLWAGMSLITWGVCFLLKKTTTPPSESTTLDNPPTAYEGCIPLLRTNANAPIYQPVTNPATAQNANPEKTGGNVPGQTQAIQRR